MPAEVLYRKWRPQRFADVSGQEIVKRTLTNALISGKVSHAYLFSGPRGTGKTTIGRLLTKAINCERNAPDADTRPGEPCNECGSCVAFNEGRALDLVELDGASNRGIDEIRKLRENVGYAPMAGREAHKVYLIDEVHMLTEPAFNALLKTLEEPPPHIVFVLATTDAHKVPQTIVSRCQRQDFKRIPLGAIVDRLSHIASAEGISIPREGLELIARSATGSLRDAINLLEQVCDSYGKEASVDAVREGLGLVADERAAVLASKALQSDLAGALAVVSAVRDDGIDLRQFQRDIISRLRDMLLVQSGAAAENAWTAEQAAELQAAVAGVDRALIVRLLKLLSDADLKLDPLSPLPLELALAEALTAPAPAARPASGPPQQRPAPAPRPAPPTRAPDFENRSARPASVERRAEVPADLKKGNITGASAEDIAKMVGSKAPVIPPASDSSPPAAEAKNGVDNNGKTAAVATAAGGAIDLATFVDQQLRPAARRKMVKYDALLNGSCHAVSWEDGVLTLGFYDDAHHKKTAEMPENRRVYEEIASALLGAPVTLRCIIAARPSKAAGKSPLVQHAVDNLGAKIVSED
jgi:DNA polymerase-3 subunit gamma/tau